MRRARRPLRFIRNRATGSREADFPAQSPGQVGERPAMDARRGFQGVGGVVRTQNHVAGMEHRVRRARRLILEHVQGGAGQPARTQRRGQRGGVDQAAAAGVHDEGARLHGGEAASVQKVARIGR